MDVSARIARRVARLGMLEVDLDAYSATFDGRALDVSSSQVELLGLLIEHHRRVISRDELSKTLGLARGRSVDVMLVMLRRALGREFVRNVRGRGWIIDARALTR